MSDGHNWVNTGVHGGKIRAGWGDESLIATKDTKQHESSTESVLIRLLQRVTALERTVSSHEVTIRSLEAMVAEQVERHG